MAKQLRNLRQHPEPAAYKGPERSLAPAPPGLASEDGDVYVIKASEKFELLAKNSMTEVTMATPAIAGRMLVYRTLRHLYGIAAK